MSRLPVVALLVFLCASCAGGSSGTPAYQLEAPAWNDVSIAIEARQSPVDPQMYEFLLYTTANRKPAHDLNVSIRMNDQDSWKQAMQDGWSGVYRRASRVVNPEADELQIQIRRGDVQSELRIPLRSWKPMTN